MISKTDRIFFNVTKELIKEATTELKLDPDKPITSGLKKSVGGISNLAFSSKHNVFQQIANWMNNPTIELSIKFASIAGKDEPSTGDRVIIKIRDNIIEGKISDKKIQKFKFYYEIKTNDKEVKLVYLNYSSLSSSKTGLLTIIIKGKEDKKEEFICSVSSQKIKNKKYWVLNVFKKYEGEEIEDGFEDVKNKGAAAILLNYYLNIKDREDLTDIEQDKYVLLLLILAKKISELASTAAGQNLYMELINKLKNEPDFDSYSIETKIDNLQKELMARPL